MVFKTLRFYSLVIIVLLATIFSNCVNGTENEKLSLLQQQLTSFKENDQRRIPVLTQLIIQTWRSNPELAAKYGENALRIHKQFSEPREKAIMLAYLSRVYLNSRDIETASRLIKQGVSAAKASNNDKALTLNLFNQAMLYNLNNEMVLALDTYQQLKTHYLKRNEMGNVGNILNNIGNIHKELGNLKEAFKYFNEAQPLIKEYSSHSNYINTISNIGEVFLLLKDYKQAESYYLRSLNLIDVDKSPLVYFEALHRLGRLRATTKEYSAAYEYYKKADSVAENYQLIGQKLAIQYELISLAHLTSNLALATSALEKVENMLDPKFGKSLTDIIHYHRAVVAVMANKWLDAEKNIELALKSSSLESRYFTMQEIMELTIEIKNNLDKPKEANTLLLEIFNDYKQHQAENRNYILAQYIQLFKTSDKETEIIRLKQQQIEQENRQLLEQQTSRSIIFAFIVFSILLLFYILLSIQRSRALRKQHALSLELIQEKKTFFANISHELRTPLSVLKLKIEELQYDVSDDPQETFSRLHHRLNSFTKLIQDISLLAEVDKNEMEVNLQEVELLPYFTESCIEFMEVVKNYDLQVTTNIDLKPGQTAYFDKARIGQVLTNVVTNSLRYTDTPGQLNMSVTVNDRDVIMTIEDSAPTLNDEQFSQIFNRLYRADVSRSRRLGGSGLGLSICKDLITAHQGSILASKSDLGGVKIEITIPTDLDKNI